MVDDVACIHISYHPWILIAEGPTIWAFQIFNLPWPSGLRDLNMFINISTHTNQYCIPRFVVYVGVQDWGRPSGVSGGHIIKLNFSSSTKGLGILFSAVFFTSQNV